MSTIDRRPLKTRQARWAQRFSAALARWGVTPNAISATSLVWAMLVGVALFCVTRAAEGWPRGLLFFAAALGIQLRLLCNMLDGMVAVEGGRRSATGELWNEVPDRIADSFILIGAGYACRDLSGGVTLGWAAALVAAMTAYLRALAGQLGLNGCFHGPMAKPHRMFLLTCACLGAAIWQVEASVIVASALGVIIVGSLVTCWRRLVALRRHLLLGQDGVG